MKNNKGFSMVELLATIVVMGILTLISVVGISSYLAKARAEYYKKQEENMVLAAKSYIEAYKDKEPKKTGSIKKVYLNDLYTSKFINEIVDRKKQPCNAEESYVNVFNTGDSRAFDFSSMLVCPDYNSAVAHSELNPVISITKHDDDDPAKASMELEIAAYNAEGITEEEKAQGLPEMLSYTYTIYVKNGSKWIEKTSEEVNEIFTTTTSKKVKLSKYLPNEIKVEVTAINTKGRISTAKEKIVIVDETNPKCIISPEDDVDYERPWVDSRTITVGCEDTGSGCVKSKYTKKFDTSGKEDKIIISDKAGHTAVCWVGKRVERPADVKAPVISGGSNSWRTAYQIIWTTQDATAPSGIAKYQYCTNNSNTSAGCVWNDLFENKTGVTNGIDVAYYHTRYGDLINEYNGDVSKLINHYNQYGKKEGRQTRDANWLKNSINFSIQGNYYVFFRAVSKTGNVSPPSNSQHLMIDVEKPQVSLSVASKAGNYNSRNTRVVINASDGVSGVKYLCFSYSNDSSKCTWQAKKSIDQDFTFPAGEGSGAWYGVYAFSKDAAGNISPVAGFGYQMYKECTGGTYIDCADGYDMSNKKCTVGWGQGWGKKGRICAVKDNITHTKCYEKARTCPCDEQCQRFPGSDNSAITYEPSAFKSHGGWCYDSYCGSVLCGGPCTDISDY